MKAGKLGTISHGTLRPEDLIPAFCDELRALRGAVPASIWRYARSKDAGDQQETIDKLIDALQEFAPDYCYFGAHPGDGSDFGFWLYEDWQEMARDDGVMFVSDLSELPDDFPGGLVCVVNDHGNATLYAQDCTGTHRELWAVV